MVYILYICCRNRRRQTHLTDNNEIVDDLDKNLPLMMTIKPTAANIHNHSTGKASNDDISRENIICYRDEGGGECDIRAYDMVPLRIQIQSAMNNSNLPRENNSQNTTGLDTIINSAINNQIESNNSGNYSFKFSSLIKSGHSFRVIDVCWQELTVI